MSEQAKVGGKLNLRLWDRTCKRSIKSRVEKGAVMIVYVRSGWLASRPAFLQNISQRVSVESVMNKRKSSCHSFARRTGSIAAWMYTAVILDLKGFLISIKNYFINIRISLLLSREKVKHSQFLKSP